MTAYDWLLLRRTVALGLLLAILIYLIMLGSDDASSTNAGRLGRLAALVTPVGGGAAFLATAQARARGEVRAFEAGGATPFRSSLGAVFGGVFVGMIGAALAFVPGVDLAPLFPQALPESGGFIARDGAWLDPARGLLFQSDGGVIRAAQMMAPGSALGVSRAGRVWPALAVAAIAFPVWATARGPVLRRALVGFTAATTAVLVFHLVAAGRVASPWLLLAPLVLLADGAVLHRRRAWS